MMLILRNEPRILLPVPQFEWREPSQAQHKDQFGNPGVQTRFRIRGRLHDGHVNFLLWFDSRDDFDWFLWSLGQYLASGTPIPREDWGLVNEIWGDPTLYPELQYDFATLTFLTTTGSNQTYDKPSDWNDSNNSIEGLAGGASGGVSRQSGSPRKGTGGGGSAYSKIDNFVFTGSSAVYRVGIGGAAITRSSNGNGPGNSGTVSYFNTSSDPGAGSDNSKLGVQPGLAGQGANSSAVLAGGEGGSDSGSWGQTRRPGGRGGEAGSGGISVNTGGGGSAGPDGNGGNGQDSSSTSSNGGSANGGATAGGATGNPPADGGSGIEWDASHGCGSGGGAATPAGGLGANGGLYGGGGAGDQGGANDIISGAGRQGLIVITYTPGGANTAAFFAFF